MACGTQQASYVIFDLDGTILDTETLCVSVAKTVLAKHGKELTPAACKAALGKRPLDCWTEVAQVLDLDIDPHQLLDETEPLLREKWPDARLLPGALRLMRHLHALGVPFAIATSTPRATFNAKMSNKPELLSLLRYVVCGDEVLNGKPGPDVFLQAARLMGAEPAHCLVVEDAPSGVEGATAAAMRVVVVPSITGPDCSEYPTPDSHASQGVVELLPSLLAFNPQRYGLPPFNDTILGMIPLEPALHISGAVVKGFGRGSKDLGIPTANVDGASLACQLAEAVTGIYAGWASVGSSTEVYKMVMSIGFNPFFKNKEKTAEPWILHDFQEPFYGQEIRLVVCAYIRPEANFTSLEALITRIHQDAAEAREALEQPELQSHKLDPWLLPSSHPATATTADGQHSCASTSA